MVKVARRRAAGGGRHGRRRGNVLLPLGKPGDDVHIALDAASTEFFENGKYNLAGENAVLTSQQMAEYLGKLVADYPIISIEDGMGEDESENLQIDIQDILKKAEADVEKAVKQREEDIMTI